MNKLDRDRLRPVCQHIMEDAQNRRLQNQFACVYDDTMEINEPMVGISMADFRTLVRLCGCSDTLSIKHLPHRKSAKEFATEEEKEEFENGNN